ncbi:hypothetical protein EYF80_060937 [Liparis tanakae]|uniref:Uncharacterized protein n=1 Tax=Liparis tanakae TaxID=230148 RepID=A0A4Z2EJH0_9TELE|nr:hypothetical protein EYF80_060937 [Liparis tanakae]
MSGAVAPGPPGPSGGVVLEECGSGEGRGGEGREGGDGRLEAESGGLPPARQEHVMQLDAHYYTTLMQVEQQQLLPHMREVFDEDLEKRQQQEYIEYMHVVFH